MLERIQPCLRIFVGESSLRVSHQNVEICSKDNGLEMDKCANFNTARGLDLSVSLCPRFLLELRRHD